MANSKGLRYADDTDRAYGVAGMAISLVLWDGEPLLASASLDRAVGSALDFTPAFGFSGNPRYTASLAWRQLLKQYEMVTAMIMGNALCRAYVGSSQPLSSAMGFELLDAIRAEGREACSLDDDEIDIIFNKTHRYLDRVFAHSGVSTLARSLADNLLTRRTMTASEVFDILAELNRM